MIKQATRLWRLVDSHEKSGVYNMAIDEAILESFVFGQSMPTIRFYQWSKPTLTIGYSQSNRDINWEQCFLRGVSVVRRPTGGRAILHGDDLAYSFIIPQDSLPASIVESYQQLNQLLISSCQILGVTLEISTNVSYRLSPVCFLTSTPCEVTVRGRKIAGSAQLRRNSLILQQNSLLLRQPPDWFLSLFSCFSPEELPRTLADFNSQAISLSAVLGEAIDVEAVKKAIVAGSSSIFGAEFIQTGLTPEEIKRSESLVNGKYHSESWNLRGKWLA